MATSGTFLFNLSMDDLLTEAWERCGKSPSVLNASAGASALRSVQLALLDWSNRGLNLWQVDRQTVMVPAGTASFTTAVGTTDILEMTVSVNSRDLVMAPIGRYDYVAQANKDYRARPTQYWVDRTNPLPVVTLYPVPDQDYTLTYYRVRLPQDMSSLVQTADAPVLWMEALSAELAARLAEKYAPEREDALRAKADRAFANAATENRERVPLVITPSFYGR